MVRLAGRRRSRRGIGTSTTTLGVDFVDIPILAAQQAPVHFTFFWTAAVRWEGRDYTVSVE